jgi:hypothetical protein
MSSGAKSDLDLLARLNALKRSPIDLSNKLDPECCAVNATYLILSLSHTSQTTGPAVVPDPAKALHADLLNRFKSLSGTGSQEQPSNALGTSENDGSLAVDDDRTVEDLLADLGPNEQASLAKTVVSLADYVC